MAEKQPEFVISDRRRFSDEGELRPDAKTKEEEKQSTPPPAKPAPPPHAAQPPANPAAQKPAGASPEAAGQQQEQELSPPTAEEQHQQNEAYKASGKKIDDMIAAAGKAGPGPMEMTFERVIESFYMSALIQMGALRQEGAQGGVAIIAARQTIDSLALLQAKTKGTLTHREKKLLQNVLFELS